MNRSISIQGFICFAVGFLLFAFASVAAFGQAEAGAIAGTVRDTSGAVISGATVTITNVATGSQRTAQTEAPGNIASVASSLAVIKYRSRARG